MYGIRFSDSGVRSSLAGSFLPEMVEAPCIRKGKAAGTRGTRSCAGAAFPVIDIIDTAAAKQTRALRAACV
jgi:hypothetical protein